MKRLLNAAGSLMGLLALAALGIGLIALLRAQPTTSGVSPLASPTLLLAAQSPLSTPTPRPTSTRPPAPPTRTPRPTFTPAPPTTTPEPLPTLIPGRQTFVYATMRDGNPELYRVQVDSAARKAGSVYRIDTRAWPTSRVQIEGLYPSPDGKRVAVAWVYGEGGYYISILDVNNGRLTPLSSEEGKVEQAVFLDWSPKGNAILVLGFDTNPNLRDGAWLVDIDTYQYNAVDIKQTTDPQRITSASFSPDGKAIVYARTDCFQCGSEVWRVALDRSDQQLLFQVPELRVEDVRWSPDGRHIAFTQWRESTEASAFAVGELRVMVAGGDERRMISPVLTGYSGVAPIWSPDGKQIAFVMNDGTKLGKRLDELRSNVYVADVSSGDVRQLTRYSRVQVLAPIWSPDGSMLAFIGNPDGVPGQLELWAMNTDGRAVHRIDESRGLTVNTNATNVAVVWLP